MSTIHKQYCQSEIEHIENLHRMQTKKNNSINQKVYFLFDHAKNQLQKKIDPYEREEKILFMRIEKPFFKVQLIAVNLNKKKEFINKNKVTRKMDRKQRRAGLRACA